MVKHVFHLPASWVRDLFSRIDDRHPKRDAEDLILSFSPSQRKAWLRGMIDAEGTKCSPKHTVVYQSIGPVRDALKLAIYLSGYRPSESKLNGKDRWEPCYGHGMCDPSYRPLRRGRKESIGRADVWCVVTDIGSWTIEQDGQIFLSGQSWGGGGPGGPSRGIDSGANTVGFDCCLHPDTLVSGPNGVKKIVDIVPGDMVWSWDNGSLAQHKVIVRSEPRQQMTYKLRLRDRTIKASGNHPFLVAIKNGDGRKLRHKGLPTWHTEWRRLDELKRGDILFGLDYASDHGEHYSRGIDRLSGPEFCRRKILEITELEVQETYDIEVDGAHNFIADGIVVHNSGLTEYAFSKGAGIEIGGVTTAQETQGKSISPADAKPGDLVFLGPAGATHHVALVSGANMIIQAPEPGKFVEEVGAGGFGGGGSAGSGPASAGQIGDWVNAGLKLAGQPLSWGKDMQKLINRESGGNPTIVNPISVGGEHATGLMQMLPSTFHAHIVAGHGDIMNPVDNIASSAGYIAGQYGSPGSIPNLYSGNYVGYKEGIIRGVSDGIINSFAGGAVTGGALLKSHASPGNEPPDHPRFPPGANIAVTGETFGTTLRHVLDMYNASGMNLHLFGSHDAIGDKLSPREFASKHPYSINVTGYSHDYMKKLMKGAVGFTDVGQGAASIVIDNSRGANLFGILAHEIGNALGLKESASSGSVTSWKEGETTKLTSSDIGRLVSMYGTKKDKEKKSKLLTGPGISKDGTFLGYPKGVKSPAEILKDGGTILKDGTFVGYPKGAVTPADIIAIHRSGSGGKGVASTASIADYLVLHAAQLAKASPLEAVVNKAVIDVSKHQLKDVMTDLEPISQGNKLLYLAIKKDIYDNFSTFKDYVSSHPDFGTPAEQAKWKKFTAHMSMSDGGLITKGLTEGGFNGVKSYDVGGVLQPGITIAHNGTGKPEQITKMVDGYVYGPSGPNPWGILSYDQVQQEMAAALASVQTNISSITGDSTVTGLIGMDPNYWLVNAGDMDRTAGFIPGGTSIPPSFGDLGSEYFFNTMLAGYGMAGLAFRSGGWDWDGTWIGSIADLVPRPGPHISGSAGYPYALGPSETFDPGISNFGGDGGGGGGDGGGGGGLSGGPTMNSGLTVWVDAKGVTHIDPAIPNNMTGDSGIAEVIAPGFASAGWLHNYGIDIPLNSDGSHKSNKEVQDILVAKGVIDFNGYTAGTNFGSGVSGLPQVGRIMPAWQDIINGMLVTIGGGTAATTNAYGVYHAPDGTITDYLTPKLSVTDGTAVASGTTTPAAAAKKAATAAKAAAKSVSDIARIEAKAAATFTNYVNAVNNSDFGADHTQQNWARLATDVSKEADAQAKIFQGIHPSFSDKALKAGDAQKWAQVVAHVTGSDRAATGGLIKSINSEGKSHASWASKATVGEINSWMNLLGPARPRYIAASTQSSWDKFIASEQGPESAIEKQTDKMRSNEQTGFKKLVDAVRVRAESAAHVSEKFVSGMHSGSSDPGDMQYWDSLMQRISSGEANDYSVLAGRINAKPFYPVDKAAAHVAHFNSYLNSHPVFKKLDEGGFLMPGLTLAYNDTGKPEQVLSPAQSQDVGGHTFNIHIHGPVFGSNKTEVARDLRNEMRKVLRSEGKPLPF
jgi:hypothetical protein